MGLLLRKGEGRGGRGEEGRGEDDGQGKGVRFFFSADLATLGCRRGTPKKLWLIKAIPQINAQTLRWQTDGELPTGWKHRRWQWAIQRTTTHLESTMWWWVNRVTGRAAQRQRRCRNTPPLSCSNHTQLVTVPSTASDYMSNTPSFTTFAASAVKCRDEADWLPVLLTV